MNKQILHVAKWEFMHFFKWKQELISKLVMIVIALVVFFWQNAHNFNQTEYKIAVSGVSQFEMKQKHRVTLKNYLLAVSKREHD